MGLKVSVTSGGRASSVQLKLVTQQALALSVVLALCAGCATPPANRVDPSSAELPAVPAEALNPDVRQETIQQTICVPGYAASVLPSTSYTTGVKAKLLRERGQDLSAASSYELDHRVPLALGGHPQNLRNLELQPWEGEAGAKKKDRLERRLQVLVCGGKVGLQAAQQAMYFDWQAAYREYLIPQ